MKQTIWLVFFLLSFFALIAQHPDSISCPKIKIDGPRGGRVSSTSNAVVAVRPFKKDFINGHSISYHWQVENGLILKGADERTVYIDTKGLNGEQIKVAVNIDGLDPGCPASATTIINVELPILRTEERILTKPAKMVQRF